MATHLLSLSAAIAAREWHLVRRKMTEICRDDRSDHRALIAVEEALLQCYLFLGFPATLEAFAIWRDVAGGAPGESGPQPRTDTQEDWQRRGELVCKTVYQGNFDKLRGNVRHLHPELDRWMIAEGYGKVLGRPGLPLADRELCNVAILAASRWERQLHSHLRGALNSGAGLADTEFALEAGLDLVPDEVWRLRARELWAAVRSTPRPAPEGGTCS